MLYRRHGASHTRVRGRQEPNQGHHQHGGVQRIGAVVLHERAALRVAGVSANVFVDLVTQRLPLFNWPLEAEAFGALYRAVESHPRHDFGVGEMLARAAHFPHAFVGFAPDLRHMIQQRA